MTDTRGTRYAQVETPLGDLTLVAKGDGLSGVYFPGHWHLPKDPAFGDEVDAHTDPVLSRVAEEIREYLSGARTDFDIPVRTHGDDFSEKVWSAIAKIPYGKTTTYGRIARDMGDPHLAQRVGQAVGRNPVSIVIPCHRVVGSDGSLTGYAGGLERKRTLLDLEQATRPDGTRLF